MVLWGLFRKKKPSTPKRISLSELSSWLKDQLIPYEESAVEELRDIGERLAQQITDIDKKLSNLENAALRNENIPEKEKHFMEGNRAAYIKKTREFLKSINIPKDISPNRWIEFAHQFNSNRASFTKSVFRAYKITSEFFGNELKDIIASLNVLDELIKAGMLHFEREKYLRLRRIKDKIAVLKGLQKEYQQLQEQIAELNEDFNIFKKQKEGFEKRKELMLKSERYAEMKELLERHNDVAADIKIEQARIIEHFGPFEKAFKKMAHSGNTLANHYIKDPVNALMEDVSLNIIKLMGEALSAIDSSKVDVDDKRREKMRAEHRILSEEYLTKIKIRFNDLRLKERQLDRSIQENPVQRDVEDADYKAKHSEEKMKEILARIQKTESHAENIPFDSEKRELESLLGEAGFKAEVIL